MGFYLNKIFNNIINSNMRVGTSVMQNRQTPLIRWLQEYLGVRRTGAMYLRNKEDLATRSPPPPNIPPGPAHKLSDNYYYNRDTRREVAKPTVIMSALEEEGVKLLGGNQSLLGDATKGSELPTPRFRPVWKISQDEPELR